MRFEFPARLHLRQVAVVAIFLAVVGGAFGQVYVTTNGTGDGSGWGASATSLSNALVVCQDGDQIWIAQGTYTNALDSTNSFIITTNNLTLYGGFTNGMAFGDRDWITHAALLSGQDTRRVVDITSTNITLDGLTIQEGYTAQYFDGAGICKTSGGFLKLANCVMRDGYVSRYGYGSGAYLVSGSAIMTNCVFVDNYVYHQGVGAGFYAENVDVVINDCTFSNNTFGLTGSGGGFYLTGGTLAVSNSSFVGNVLNSGGGGAGAGGYVDDAPARFRNCIFRGNDSTAIKHGGALYIAAGSANTVTVENCTFTDNSANGGGVFYAVSGSLIIKNSILWSNTAAGQADEIYMSGGNASVDYTCLTGVGEDDIYGNVSLSHCTTDDPLFVAEFTDLHLKSSTGRWDAASGVWTNDAVHSPCIDVGDPTEGYSYEPANNGSRVNLGAYGNTAEASKSHLAAAPVVVNRPAVVVNTAATLKGELASGTLSGITIYYGTNQAGLGSQNSAEVYPPQRTGSVFSAEVTGLLPSQAYYFACFATNAAGTNWAAVTNFTSGEEPISGGADIVHVDKDASGAQTGLNWLDAYLTLGAAVAAANDATNEIWVADGTYLEGAQVEIATNVSIYGGFTGSESNRNDRSLTNEAIFSGNDTYRVILITSTNVILDGLIIHDGRAAAGESGGGIYKTSGGPLALANCIIRDNYVPGVSGGGSDGGGACFSAGSVIMTNCVFVDNYGNHRALGVGFYAANADITINDCTFSNNTFGLTGSGAGFYLTGGTLAVSNSSFVGNELNSGGGGTGAGGHVQSAPAQFKNCIFRNNDSTINKNGAGLYIAAGSATTVTVENCTFVGNFAANGAAAHVLSGILDVKSCTMVDNSTAGNGGAFYIDGGELYVQNSILWSNSAVSGDEVYRSTGNGTVDYSCLTGTGEDDVYGAIALSNCMTNDPLFATQFTDLHLRSISGRWDSVGSAWTNDAVHSPCIDVGAPTEDYSKEPANNGGRLNMGAYGNTAKASKSPNAVAPVVVNRAAETNLTVAMLKGELMSGTLSEITIYYGTNQIGLGSQDSVEVYPPRQTGSVFSARVTGLLATQVYYYACFATNAAGTNWATVTNFTTGAEPPSGGSDIIHVDKNAVGAQNGLNWLDAYLTLGAAVAAANDATNEIWVADGTYTEGEQVVIATNVSIYGGFSGAETNRNDRSLTNEAIFSGNDSYRVMLITSTNVILDGLIICDGQITLTDSGAGIYKSSTGPLLLVNCTMRDNYVPGSGVGGSDGGGACFSAGSVIMTNCVFVDNFGQHRTSGAGFYAANVDVIINDCTFSNNIFGVSGAGAGFRCNGGSLVVSNSSFIGNELNSVGSGGGAGGYVDSAPAQFINCIFRSNDGTANKSGGGLCIVAGSATTVTVENCTFSDNSAANGGALYVASGNVILKNSILWTNAAAVTADEIYATGSDSDVDIEYCDLTGTNSTYVVTNIDATVVWGNGILTADPLFASSTDLHLKSLTGRWIGPDTWTKDIGSSPCIDAGDPQSSFQKELVANGGRINLGAYGNTMQASKSLPNPGTVFMFQ